MILIPESGCAVVKSQGHLGNAGWGNKAHEAHLENAILIVDIYDGTIHAGIFSNGQTTIFSKVDKETADYFQPEVVYGFLPGALRQWVRWDEIRELRRLAPQTNFRWVK